MRVSNLQLNQSKSSEMHSSLRKILLVCRWFGFFLVEGLRHPTPEKLRFNMKSLYSIYYLSTVTMMAFLTAVQAYAFLTSGVISYFNQFIFLFMVMCSTVVIFRLSRQWPLMIKRTAALEQRLTPIRTDKRVAMKCAIIGGAVLICGFFEHFVFVLFVLRVASICSEGSEQVSMFETYFRFLYPYIFQHARVEFNFVIGIVLQVFTIQSTFIWNYMDLLIMCISVYLSSYYRDLNKFIKSQKQSKHQWSVIRNYYSQIVLLVKEVDTHLDFGLLLSFSCNLFYICLQLYNAFRYSGEIVFTYCSEERVLEIFETKEHYFYFFYSFMYLIGRTLALSLFVAEVHTAAQEPLFALAEVSAADYTIEIQRFTRQIKYTAVGLSGILFHVTRPTILTVVATIITYELMLLQFGIMDSHSYNMTRIVFMQQSDNGLTEINGFKLNGVEI